MQQIKTFFNKKLFLALVCSFFSLAGFCQLEFITTWQTSNGGTITIPTNSSYTYYYTVDWGDGTVTSGHTGNASHTYTADGTNDTIKISGIFPAIYFKHAEDKHKILSLEQWGDIGWKSMKYAFAGCSVLTYNAIDAPNLSNVTSLRSMFSYADSFNGDLSNWNVSNVTEMNSMFWYAPSFNGNVSTWDVSNVTDMTAMFAHARSFNGDVSKWEVGNVTKMGAMFGEAHNFNGDLSNWDVSSVTSMLCMFSGARSFNGDLSNWDVSKVTDMSEMFDGAYRFNGDLSKWDVSNVGFMLRMFANAHSFNGDLNSWNVSKVSDMRYMFIAAGSFSTDLSNWNVSSAIDMTGMFRYAVSFNGDLSNWNVSKVTDMTEMFYAAYTFNGDLSNWDVSKVTKMNNMFKYVTLSTASYDALLKSWGAQNVQNNVTLHGGYSNYCSGVCARFSLESKGWKITDSGEDCSHSFITTWDVINHKIITIPTNPSYTYDYTVDWGDGNVTSGHTGDATHTYSIGSIIGTIKISGTFPAIYFNNSGDKKKIRSIKQWGNNAWEDMSNAFFGCDSLTHIAPDAPDLSNVTSLSQMFRKAKMFDGNLHDWDVSTITNMYGLFFEASVFSGDGISSWDVSNVTTMHNMFQQAFKFNGDISNWNVSNVTHMRNMFLAANGFKRDLSLWDVSNVTNMEGMFRANSAGRWAKWNIGNWDVSAVNNMRYMFLNAKGFNENIGNWDVSAVTRMHQMFYGASSFNQDLNNWNVEKVTGMERMFDAATAFNGNISDWNTQNVKNMSGMFRNAVTFDQDLSAWNVEKVTAMDTMFSGATLSSTNYDALLTSWSAQHVQSNVSFDAGNSKYCTGESGRNNLFDNHNWIINDGGKDSSCAGSFNTYAMASEQMPFIKAASLTEKDEAKGTGFINTSTELVVPGSFSPNGDGINDYFVIHGMDKFSKARMRIYNLMGSLIYKNDNYGNIRLYGTNAYWNGRSDKSGGSIVATGTYIYLLELNDGNVKTGKVVVTSR